MEETRKLFINNYGEILQVEKITPLGAFVSTLYRNSEKEKSEDITSSIKTIISKPNDIVMIHSDERSLNLTETTKILKETIQEALTSLKTDKNGFRWIQFDGGHFFGLCIHQNKIILFDTIGNNAIASDINGILNNKDIQQELKITDFKFINLNQQTDLTSCPTFTSYNIKKLKNAFLKNPELFDGLFDTTKIKEDGTITDKELYKKFNIIPSIQRKWLFNEVDGFNIMKQMFKDKKKEVTINEQDESMENFSIKKDGDMILEQNYYNFNNNYIPLKQKKSIQLLKKETDNLLNELDIYNYLKLDFDSILKEVQKPVYRFGKFNYIINKIEENMEERKIFNDETKQILTYFGSVLNIHAKLSKYTQKDKHKEQNDLLNNIDYVAIEDGILSEQQNFQNKVLKIIEKSKQNNSYEYLQVKCYGHVFFLCIRGDKILLIDSLDFEESENYSYRQIEFENESFFQKNNIFFRRIGIDQQKSKIGCPVFTVRNLIKLDKFFKENPDYFDKIFETKTEIKEDGMKILPLFPLLQDIQSISRIEELSGTKIEYNTEPQEDSFVIENHKKEKIIINITNEEKAKIFFGSTKEEQEEKLKKLVKYIEFNKLEKKLQNLRIDVKREKYYKDLENVSEELLDYVNEKVVNSLC